MRKSYRYSILNVVLLFILLSIGGSMIDNDNNWGYLVLFATLFVAHKCSVKVADAEENEKTLKKIREH